MVYTRNGGPLVLPQMQSLMFVNRVVNIHPGAATMARHIAVKLNDSARKMRVQESGHLHGRHQGPPEVSSAQQRGRTAGMAQSPKHRPAVAWKLESLSYSPPHCSNLVGVRASLQLHASFRQSALLRSGRVPPPISNPSRKKPQDWVVRRLSSDRTFFYLCYACSLMTLSLSIISN